MRHYTLIRCDTIHNETLFSYSCYGYLKYSLYSYNNYVKHSLSSAVGYLEYYFPTCVTVSCLRYRVIWSIISLLVLQLFGVLFPYLCYSYLEYYMSCLKYRLIWSIIFPTRVTVIYFLYLCFSKLFEISCLNYNLRRIIILHILVDLNTMFI